MVLIQGLRPWGQGSLDSLCGPYSLINALMLVKGPLGTAEAAEAVWRLLDALPGGRPVAQVWHEGAGPSDMTRMIRRCLARRYSVKVTRPFYGQPKISLSAYWERVTEFLNDGPHRAVVLVMDGADYSHWTVAHAATRDHLELFDSWGWKRLLRRECTTATLKANRPVLLYPDNTFFLQNAALR
ncbi:MAG: hypothetical protein K9K66_10800 [Desulfarculaceae bacterium]|nr:hypothetical protein [Desulfarculaceae bacterium]MCF8102136.1 hypothetical protein [Desulfarculaceae bacterium]MCF8118319.1 hypothetical protein [Desulfarculaceae bacterium]